MGNNKKNLIDRLLIFFLKKSWKAYWLIQRQKITVKKKLKTVKYHLAQGKNLEEKIIITGTGRAGTTFLVQLLTRLGMDTGFEPYNEDFSSKIRAGCELRLFVDGLQEQREKLATAPRILKHPEYCYRLKGYLEQEIIRVKHIFIPIREIKSAAQSRLKAGLRWKIPGIEFKKGDCLSNQEKTLTWALGKLIETIILFDLPFTFLKFPKLVKDEDYCYQQLSQVFRLKRERFSRAYQQLSKPKLLNL